MVLHCMINIYALQHLTAPTTSHLMLIYQIVLELSINHWFCSKNYREHLIKLHFQMVHSQDHRHGVYTHGVMVIKNVFLVKLDLEFDTWVVLVIIQMEQVFIVTQKTTRYEDDGQCCDSVQLTDGTAAWYELGSWFSIICRSDKISFQAEATNLNGTGADMKAWLLDSDGNLATTRAEAEAGAKLMGQATFATPVVVTEMTSGFNMAFQINQGATIWDEEW